MVAESTPENSVVRQSFIGQVTFKKTLNTVMDRDIHILGGKASWTQKISNAISEDACSKEFRVAL